MDFISVHIAMTVLMFTSFVALVIWAWSGRRKDGFDSAARAPLEQDESTSGETHG